jgi:hypothetical protein
VRPGGSESVEIPASEGGRVDCVGSYIVIGRLCRTHLSVTMAWTDVKWLTQADVRRLAQEARTAASLPTEQAPQSASSVDILEAEAGPLVQAVALELRLLSPEGRPRGVSREELARRTREASGGKFPMFSLPTLDRAIRLAWPPRHRKRRAKAHQT